MELNIAFSTIFYIAIFIIPGLIFRRIYFSGEHNKQFSQGNLVERVIWTIFNSVLVILVFTILVYILKYRLNYSILTQLKYENVFDVFGIVGDNKLPEKDTFKLVYQDFVSTVILLYLIAFIGALTLRNVVIKFGLDRRFSFLKFNNYWYYFLRGKAPHLDNLLIKKFLWTEADVMVDNGNEGIKMYSGVIVDYYIDNNNNQLDILFLKDTKRYKFLSDTEVDNRVKSTPDIKNKRKYELREIPGNTFCIPFNKIHNLNLRYFSRPTIRNSYNVVKFFNIFVALFSIIITIILLISLFIEEWILIGKINLFLRVVFFFNSMFVWALLVSFLNSLIVRDNSKDLEYLPLLLFFFSQYLWILQIFNFVWVLPISLSVVMLILSWKKKK